MPPRRSARDTPLTKERIEEVNKEGNVEGVGFDRVEPIVIPEDNLIKDNAKEETAKDTI